MLVGKKELPEYASFINAALQGETTVGAPFASKIMMKGATGVMRPGLPTMFVCAPTPSRKHPTAAVWITSALVAALAGYPLNFGPACWLADNGIELPMRATAIVYKPLLRIASFFPRPIRRLLRSYAEWHAGQKIPTWRGPREDPIEAGVIERLLESD